MMLRAAAGSIGATTRAVVAAAILASVATVLSAHEVTYAGTVVAVEQNPYAASDGVLGTIDVKVTPGGRTRSFDITSYTRLWRGQTPVSFTDARIEPGEAVVLTWIDEEAEKGAQEIRFGSLTKNSAELQ
jgi:hypothetical protein